MGRSVHVMKGYMFNLLFMKNLWIFSSIGESVKSRRSNGSEYRYRPKINHAEVEHMHKLVEESVKQGATIACGGGSPEGNFFQKGYWLSQQS